MWPPKERELLKKSTEAGLLGEVSCAPPNISMYERNVLSDKNDALTVFLVENAAELSQRLPTKCRPGPGGQRVWSRVPSRGIDEVGTRIRDRWKCDDEFASPTRPIALSFDRATMLPKQLTNTASPMPNRPCCFKGHSHEVKGARQVLRRAFEKCSSAAVTLDDLHFTGAAATW